MAEKEIKVKVSAVDATKSGLDKATSSIKGFADNATTAIKGIFAAIAVEKLAEFFKSAVDRAVEAEKSFIQVGNALRNIGINAAAVRPQVEAFAKQVSNISGVKVEEVEQAFTTLIRRTGDYKTAQDLLLPTLDVAAARQLDVAKAADTVAKAHDGSTKAMKIVMNTTGAAADQNSGYIKTLNMIRNAWNEVLVKLGDAILKGDGLTSSGNKMVDMLKNVSTWIEDHQTEIQKFRDDVLDLAEAFGSLAVKVLGAVERFKEFYNKTMLAANAYLHDKSYGLIGLVQDPNAQNPNVSAPQAVPGFKPALTPPTISDKPIVAEESQSKAAEKMRQEIEDYTKLIELRSLTSEQLKTLTALYDSLSARLAKGNLNLHDEVELREQLTKLGVDIGLANAQTHGGIITGTNLTPTVVGTPTKVTPLGVAPITNFGKPTTDLPQNQLEHAASQASAFFTDQVRTQAEEMVQIGQEMEDAWTGAFAAIGSGKNVWDSFATAGKKAVADVAGMLAKNEAAKGVAALAESFFPPNPAAAASAAEHFAASALFAAIGGAIGGSTGGVGRTGGGSPGGFNRNVDDVNNTGTATITINGGLLDMSDPRQATALAEAIGSLTGRRIIVQGH